MSRKQTPKQVNYLIGIDEVGRGPIAGPVTVGIFMIEKKHLRILQEIGVMDSKKISEKKRHAISHALYLLKQQGLCDFVCISQSAHMVDTKGIMPCIKKSIAQGLKKLSVPNTTPIFLDGGLCAPDTYSLQETIIKGDQKIPVISAASIVAKVHRDACMIRYGKKYPEYHFEKHKGYGTKKHYENIELYGLLPWHRKTFLNHVQGIDKKLYL